MNDSINQIKHIPNNWEGRQFVRSLRRFLKSTPNSISVRGRGPRQPFQSLPENKNRKLRQDLPLKFATHFTVYIMERPKFRYVKTQKTVTEYVKTPTKWATSIQRKQIEVDDRQSGMTFGG
jgi:hypothetical protein